MCKVTPIKRLDLVDPSGQLKLDGLLYIFLFLCWLHGQGTILLAIRERRTHLIRLYERVSTISYIYFGLSRILFTMLYLDDW